MKSRCAFLIQQLPVTQMYCRKCFD